MKRNDDFEKFVDNISTIGYNVGIGDGGEMMPTKDIIESMLEQTNIKQKEAAKLIGREPRDLNSKLMRGTLKADDFLSLLDAIGIEVRYFSKETGKELRERIKGAGRPVKRMVDRVVYDTNKSDALANNFYADGTNMYNDGRARELYRDSEGRYFFAEYSSDETCSDRINPISASDAADFIEKYGTEIHKEPEAV